MNAVGCGSYLVEMDNKALLTHVDINNVVCAMPLPYTRLYEGLASGLKARRMAFLYYAHMRGADIRVECLLNGVYDMAVVSRLAAESYLTQRIMPRAGVGTAYLRWRAPVDLP